jgi:hypothetical protein
MPRRCPRRSGETLGVMPGAFCRLTASALIFILAAIGDSPIEMVVVIGDLHSGTGVRRRTAPR